MQSFIRKFDGNLARLKKIEWDPASLPFQVARNGSAVIIGSAGGYEVLCALSHGFKRIVAIEMDPVICELLKNEYADYTGNMFHLPQVSLLADEGRSALKRMDRKFDVIQMVNSHNADLLLSGALSISETYIYTVESFKDYWEHLQPDGFVYIVHWNGERLFSTALKALREMGVERPEDKFFIVQYPGGFNNFFLKKGELTAGGLRDPQGRPSANRGRSSSPRTRSKDNLYADMVRRPGRDGPGILGQHRPGLRQLPLFQPAEPHRPVPVRKPEAHGHGGQGRPVRHRLFELHLPVHPRPGAAPLVPLHLPPAPAAADGRRDRSPLILYFFFIGLAFILVEIIFIKIFQLFLGSPAVSISIIIFSLLVSSGIGSLFSDRLGRSLGPRRIPALAVLLAVVLTAYGFGLFPLLNGLMFLPNVLRIVTSFLLISLAGLLHGLLLPGRHPAAGRGRQGPDRLGVGFELVRHRPGIDPGRDRFHQLELHGRPRHGGRRLPGGRRVQPGRGDEESRLTPT